MSNVVRGSWLWRLGSPCLADHDAEVELRGRRAALRRGRPGRDRRLGAEARRGRATPRRSSCFEASGLESAGRGARGPVDPAAAAARRARRTPAERIEAYLPLALHRLAPFRPSGLVCLTGTGEGRDPDEARATSSSTACGRSPREAERHGLRIGSSRTSATAASTGRSSRSIPEAVELIARRGRLAGARDPVRRLAPLEHADALRRHRARGRPLRRRARLRPCASRPAAGPTARCPATGRPTSPAILRALDDAGWDGLYDIEIFSDDGTFGIAYPDSYWAAPADDVLAQARAAFERCWDATRALHPPRQ